MGGLFSKPKAPDTSRQEAIQAEQERRADAQEKRQLAELAARRRARRRGSRALTFNEEQQKANKLGRNETLA